MQTNLNQTENATTTTDGNETIEVILGDLLSRYVDLLDEGGHGGWSLSEDETALRAFNILKNANASDLVSPLARRSLRHHLTIG